MARRRARRGHTVRVPLGPARSPRRPAHSLSGHSRSGHRRHRHRPHRLLPALVLALALVLPAAGPAAADPDPGPGPDPAPEPVATVLTAEAPARYAGSRVPVRLLLTDEAGEPVAGAALRLERRRDGVWSEVPAGPTDETGSATAEVEAARAPKDNRVRASYDGDETHAPSGTGLVRLRLRRRNADVRLDGPGSVVDEQSVRLRVRVTTGAGEPVEGPVRLERRAGRRWVEEERLRLDQRGRAATRVAPREDTRYRARVTRRPWLDSGTSTVHRLDNRPPGTPVALPKGAPRPRRSLPAQPRAVGEGSNAKVSRIPGGVWKQMTGRSWHAGCPVGRASLRLLRINYWGYDGYRYRGELVAHADAVGRMSRALADMYARELPIRSMYRVDRFGWSKRLKGADDHASMAAGNTSAFNCRQVVGRPGVRSPHSWGRSLDVNPWENPYRTSGGWLPTGWWVGRSHPRVAWRSGSHAVVSLMRGHGVRWTYGTADAHHFDAPAGGGRTAGRGDRPHLPPVCDHEVCH